MDEENGEDKCQEYLDGWKRALADYENLKKDLPRERAEQRQYLAYDLASELMPALDSFELAMKHLPNDGWTKGFQAVQSQFVSALQKIGVERFGAIGEVFDPTLHESLGERSEPASEPNTIVEVLQPGWRIEHLIIRPAKVIINN